MKMIVGGAFHGKTDCAKKLFDISESDIVDGKSCSSEACFSAVCINSYHEVVRRLIAEGEDPVEFTERLCRENPDVIVIMDEIGCGIVPIEKSERIRRELTGRSGCIIAKNSCLVLRVCCGIVTAVKGEFNED